MISHDCHNHNPKKDGMISIFQQLSEHVIINTFVMLWALEFLEFWCILLFLQILQRHFSREATHLHRRDATSRASQARRDLLEDLRRGPAVAIGQKLQRFETIVATYQKKEGIEINFIFKINSIQIIFSYTKIICNV